MGYTVDSGENMSQYKQLDWIDETLKEQVTIRKVVGDHFSVLGKGQVEMLGHEISDWFAGVQ